jgi:hypothetical protein
MKTKAIFFALMLAMALLNSCGTILGGRIDRCQRIKGESGTPTRSIRPFALIGDVFIGGFIINLIVDFADGAIYKPCEAYPTPHNNNRQQASFNSNVYQQSNTPQATPQQNTLPTTHMVLPTNNTVPMVLPNVYKPQVGDTVSMEECSASGQDLNIKGFGIITGIQDATHWVVTYVLNGQNTTGTMKHQK